MKTKTVYICEGCGYESEDPSEVERCERNAVTCELPPIGSRVRLLSEYFPPSKETYTVIDHGIWPGDGCSPHESAFKTDPPCGDCDWGIGFNWWSGNWEIVS